MISVGIEFNLPAGTSAELLTKPMGRFLMEAIQRLGEWDGIRRTLGSGDPVLRFTDYEWKLSAVRGHERSELLLLIDGRRSLEELVRQSGLTHLEVGRVVAPLVAAGSLEVIPRPAA